MRSGCAGVSRRTGVSGEGSLCAPRVRGRLPTPVGVNRQRVMYALGARASCPLQTGRLPKLPPSLTCSMAKGSIIEYAERCGRGAEE